MFTQASLNEFFLDTVFEREKPAKRQEYLLVCGREIEALSSSKRHREKIQMLLSDTEGSVLDNANLSTTLLELRKELGKAKNTGHQCSLGKGVRIPGMISYRLPNFKGRGVF